nr:hypothetical protein [uncultured Campylobacter sp.]
MIDRSDTHKFSFKIKFNQALPAKNGKFDGVNLKSLGVKFCGAGKTRKLKYNLNLRLFIGRQI